MESMDYDLAVPEHPALENTLGVLHVQATGDPHDAHNVSSPFHASTSAPPVLPTQAHASTSSHHDHNAPSDHELGYLRLISSRGEPLHFYVCDSAPNADAVRQKILAYGGIIAKLASRAQYLLVDQSDFELPNILREFETQQIRGKIVDVRWLDSSIGARQRLPVSDFKPRKPRKIKAKSDRKYHRTVAGRKDFTPEEDLILAQYLRAHPKGRRGNTAYMEIAARHPTHTWQSWRNRYVKDEARILGIIDRLEREAQESILEGRQEEGPTTTLNKEEIRPKRKMVRKPQSSMSKRTSSTSSSQDDIHEVSGFGPELPDINTLEDLSGAALALVQAHQWSPGAMSAESDMSDGESLRNRDGTTGPSVSSSGDIVVGVSGSSSATAAIEAALASAGTMLTSGLISQTILGSDLSQEHHTNEEEDKRLTVASLMREYALTHGQAADVWYSCSGSKEISDAFAKILLGEAETEEELLNLQNDAVWAEIWSPEDDDIVLKGPEEERDRIEKEKGDGSVDRRRKWLLLHNGQIGQRRYPFENT